LVQTLIVNEKDLPCDVKRENVAEDGSHEESRFEGLAPIVPWDKCWQSEAKSQDQWNVEP
jgi:hypothetical protein